MVYDWYVALRHYNFLWIWRSLYNPNFKLDMGFVYKTKEVPNKIIHKQTVYPLKVTFGPIMGNQGHYWICILRIQ